MAQVLRQLDGDAEFNMKASCAAVDAGLKLTGTPERELAWLPAAAKRCPEYQAQPCIDAMRDLAKRWPDDPDAQTIYAESLPIPARWHWYAPDGTAAPGVAESEHTLEEVLRRWPDHPGANHLYIHAVASSPTQERAIASAQRLMGIMPWAGHMVHMPGHIWLVLGDYEMAAAANQRAVEADMACIMSTICISSRTAGGCRDARQTGCAPARNWSGPCSP